MWLEYYSEQTAECCLFDDAQSLRIQPGFYIVGTNKLFEVLYTAHDIVFMLFMYLVVVVVAKSDFMTAVSTTKC